MAFIAPFVAAALAFGTQSGSTPPTKTSQADADKLLNMDVNDLLNVKVTSTSKTEVSAFTVPAAISVITKDDIKKSGALTVPELLRQIPGVQVAQYDSAAQAISVRGFNGWASDKLLVLVDGRSIYSPDIAGVYWEIEDMILENIERIEVVRGPGGSLWGTNAVDGIINIITKNAHDTLGGLTVQEAGDVNRNQSIFQYGASLGNMGAVRVFGKYGITREELNPDGTGAGIGHKLGEYGFRADLTPSTADKVMVQGAYNRTGVEENVTGVQIAPPYTYSFQGTDMTTTAHLLTKWDHNEKGGGQTSVQAYYDLVDYPYSTYGNTDMTYDFDYQHQFASTEKQSLIVGAGYRRVNNDTWGGHDAVYVPPTHIDQIASFFAQESILLMPKNHLQMGLKLENNNYLGWAIQPSLRYSYTPDADRTLWASVSRAVRTPSLTDAQGDSLTSVTGPTSPGGMPTTSETLAAQTLKEESVVANELGYRFKAGTGLVEDIAAFYNMYSDLLYYAPGAPFTSDTYGVLHTVDPTYETFGDKGETYGLEASTRYEPGKNLHFTGSYSWLQQSHFDAGTTLASPHHHVTFHAEWDLPKGLMLNTYLYWNDAIFDSAISAYTKMDMNLQWAASKTLTFTVGGTDLFVPYHIEVAGGNAIRRTVFAKLAYKF